MNIRTIFLSLFFLLAVFAGWSDAVSQVTVDAKIDSTAIFIGEQTSIVVEVSSDKGKKVEFPVYDSLQNIVPGVEVLRSTDPDTSLLNDERRVLLTKKYIITSFDTALYYIPPVQVNVDGRKYQSKSLALKVITFDIDTVHTDSIFGMKSEMAPPFSWDDWDLLVWLSIIVVILTGVLLYVIVRLKDNKPIIRRIKLKPHLAPHKAAMQKIEHIKEEKIWQKEDSKEYYTQLTDTLRTYIKERYGFNAMEMTSFEIIQHLTEFNDDQAISELRELFQTADLVKFAKYSTLINENDRNLVSAIEYINQTKIEETQPQPTEIVVVEKRSRMAKIIFWICIGVAALALAGVISYMVYRIIFFNL